MKLDEPLIQKINGFLAEAFEVDPERILPEANLRDVLELDSLDYVDLVVVIENNFSFKVKPEDFKDIHSFQDFYQYIRSRLPPKENSDAIILERKVQG